MSYEEEVRQVEAIGELIAYYKDVFTILSSCAARQLEEVTFRRVRVQADELVDSAVRHFQRMIKKRSGNLQLKVEVRPLELIGDVVLLRFMLESLINEALTHSMDGLLELRVYQEGAFVRFDFIDRRRSLSQEELNHLFYPHLSRMQASTEDILTGTEYLVCKQIIREHDEFAGRRGCRINACEAEGGGFMVWFTIPSR
jgi:K+-sensing histidine kinase KdpD